jgi:hypothetical protein
LCSARLAGRSPRKIRSLAKSRGCEGISARDLQLEPNQSAKSVDLACYDASGEPRSPLKSDWKNLLGRLANNIVERQTRLDGIRKCAPKSDSQAGHENARALLRYDRQR